jgi:hypothetical protein
MKEYFSHEGVLLAIVAAAIAIGCSNSYDFKLEDAKTKTIPTNSRLVFVKSSTFNWNQRRVEISFEDAFQQFYSVDIKGNVVEYELTDNNLQQGITVKLKVTDYAAKSEKTNEIMIESFYLSKGKNQFTIAYIGNKPYIIY